MQIADPDFNEYRVRISPVILGRGNSTFFVIRPFHTPGGINAGAGTALQGVGSMPLFKAAVLVDDGAASHIGNGPVIGLA